VDDYAVMVNELQTRMSRGEIAAAIGVEEQEVDEIASGYVPDEEIGLRLRELAASGGKRSGMRVPVWAIVAFVVFDTLLFLILMLVFLLR
jgi:hypothetical protein